MGQTTAIWWRNMLLYLDWLTVTVLQRCHVMLNYNLCIIELTPD